MTAAKLVNARLRVRAAEDKQLRAMTIAEYEAYQLVIEKARDELALIEGRRHVIR